SQNDESSAKEAKRREQLLILLSVRDELDREELESLKLPLLEKLWTMGEGSGAKSPAKPPTKTPAKATSAALSRASNIKLLGSPLDALRAAKSQSGGVAKAALVTSGRKRHNSSSDLDDLDDIVKRPRLDPDVFENKLPSAKPFKSSGASKPSSLATSRPSPRKPSAQSKRPRATSSAPTVISVSSASMHTGSKYESPGGDSPDIDEMIELSEDEDVGATRKRGRRAVMEPGETGKSKKAKCSDYKGMWRKLLDMTFKIVCARLGHDGMFPEQQEYDRLIRKSWAAAAKELGVDVGKYSMDDGHEGCVKRRVGSYRGRVRDRIKPAIANVYKLSSKSGGRLVKHVQSLQAGAFHKLASPSDTISGAQPGVEGRSGNYQHPFIAECIYQTFFVGRAPVGISFPELYNPIPIPAIAYVAAVIEFLISQYQDGTFKESRAEAAAVGELYDTHLPNVELFQECRARKCAQYREGLYVYAMKKAGKPVKGHRVERTGPGVLTREDFEDEDEDDGDDDADDEDADKAVPPAKPQSRTRETSPSGSDSPSIKEDSSSDNDND
ncbi:hypothetical protein FRC06_009501, partial [Ceratobasidium sp. 370]